MVLTLLEYTFDNTRYRKKSEVFYLFTIGSFLLILLLVWGRSKFKNNYLVFLFKLLIVCTVYLNVGYFLKVGTFELSYGELLTFIVVVMGLLIKKKTVPMVPLITIFLFGIVVLLGYLKLTYSQHPPLVLPTGEGWDSYFYGRVGFEPAEFNSSHIMRVIRITLFFMIYYIFDKFILNITGRAEEIKLFVVKFGIIIALLGVVEQFVKLVISQNFFADTLGRIFGVGNSQLNWFVERGGLPVLQGFMLEPGHYAQSFIPAIMILFLDRPFTKWQRFGTFILFAYVIFFSGSFAGFAIVLLMVALYMLSEKRKIFVRSLLLLMGFAIGFLTILKRNPEIVNYYMNRVSAFLHNENIGSSESVRLISVNYALDLVKNYPFLGVGFGTTDVSGFVPSMLINFGILGTILWIIIMLNGFVKSEVKHVFWLFILAPLFFFIGGVRNIYGFEMILIFAYVFRQRSENKLANNLKSVNLEPGETNAN